MTRRAVAWLAFAALTSVAQATTFTCVGADGRKSFSDLPCPAGSNETARNAAAPANTARHGLSFGLMPLDASFKDVQPAITEAGDRALGASCHAAPAPIDRPRGGTCDPCQGDTVCSRSLPLLCYRPGVRSARAPTRVDANGGQVTPPARDPDHLAQLGGGPIVRGDRLLSESTASAMCEQALGSGWRMARFHDQGGWQIPALRHASLPAAASTRAASAGRYWVSIADQRANCWDPLPAPKPSAAAQQGAEDRQIIDEVRNFRSSAQYAKMSARCRGIVDRVERSPNQADAMNEALFEFLQHCSAALTPRGGAAPR